MYTPQRHPYTPCINAMYTPYIHRLYTAYSHCEHVGCKYRIFLRYAYGAYMVYIWNMYTAFVRRIHGKAYTYTYIVHIYEGYIRHGLTNQEKPPSPTTPSILPINTYQPTYQPTNLRLATLSSLKNQSFLVGKRNQSEVRERL